MATVSVDDGAIRLTAVQRTLALYLADPSEVSDEELEVLRRDARAAIDRLDDEPEFDDAHNTLDEVGLLVRRARPRLCLLAESGNDFTQNCPIALGHIRLGFSVGLEIEESHCSICQGDPWTCPHVPGELYEGESMVRVITKAKMFEVSVVNRPDFPDARLLSQPFARAEVEAAVGGLLPPAARPVCDRCLTSCPGI